MSDAAISAGEFGLRDYLRVLARRRVVLALTVAVIVGATLVVSLLQSTEYAAEAKVVLRESNAETVFDTSGNRVVDPARVIQTEIEMFDSGPVEDKVRAALGSVPDVSARPIAQTDVIAVRARHADPRRAADIANAYARAYIDVRREQAVNDLLSAAQQIQDKIGELQVQIDATADPDQKSRLRDQQGVFNAKLDQLQVDSELKRGGAQLASPAKVPEDPVAPQPVRAGLLALAVSLFLGVGLAFLVEFLDDSIKGKEDVQRAAPGLQVLGLIPAVPSWKAPEEARVVSVDEPAAPPAEAYRTLRTAVQFLALDRPVNLIQLTSANAQEGKTTTLANLGVAFARAGHRVVLVCCDLRRPRLHEFFGLTNAVGLTSVFLGTASLESALQRTQVDRLWVLASGPLPPNPSELLASRRVADLFDTLKNDGFLVLLDSPPILPVTDALVLSKRVDATLLVCVTDDTTRKELGRSVELLRQVNAPLVGAIVNGVTEEGGYGYSYRYYAATNGTATANGNGVATRRRRRRRRARAARG